MASRKLCPALIESLTSSDNRSQVHLVVACSTIYKMSHSTTSTSLIPKTPRLRPFDSTIAPGQILNCLI